MIRHTFTRPDWENRPPNSTQRDTNDLPGPDCSTIGSQTVLSHPNIAVQRQDITVPQSFVRETEIRNVPTALGIVDVECTGEVIWRIHGRDIPLSGRRQMLMYLKRPEDGFSYIYKGGAHLRMNSTFASAEKLRRLAEADPARLAALCDKMEHFGMDDGIIDLSCHLGEPLQQNALAAIFAQPMLGNASEDFLFDSLATYIGSCQPGRVPSASLRKARYDAALRSKIHDARDLVEASLKQPPSLSELARAVGTNDNYLKAGFRHEFGTTVYGYLHECRMRAARRLLLDTDFSIEQVALEVGYTDPMGFYAPFKRSFGITPGQFREQQRR